LRRNDYARREDLPLLRQKPGGGAQRRGQATPNLTPAQARRSHWIFVSIAAAIGAALVGTITLVAILGQPPPWHDPDPCGPIKDSKARELCLAPPGELARREAAAAAARSFDPCREHTTDRQRNAAQSMIRRRGYDCATVDTMCPYILSEGFTVSCNNFRYVFEIENHGGVWTRPFDAGRSFVLGNGGDLGFFPCR
jgi:hypothetical protein